MRTTTRSRSRKRQGASRAALWREQFTGRTRFWLEDSRDARHRLLEWIDAKNEVWHRPLRWVDTHRSTAIAGLLLLLSIAAFQTENLRILGAYLAAPESLPRLWLLALVLFASLGIAVLLSPLLDRVLDREAVSEADTVLDAELCAEEEDAQSFPTRSDTTATPRPNHIGHPLLRPAPSRQTLKQVKLCPNCQNPLIMATRHRPGMGLVRVLRCEECGEGRFSHRDELGVPNVFADDDDVAPKHRMTPRAPRST